MRMTLFLILLLLQSCTYNISIVDTHGQASDVIDSNQSADADVKPNLNIPAV